jgi:hypothetical protein
MTVISTGLMDSARGPCSEEFDLVRFLPSFPTGPTDRLDFLGFMESSGQMITRPSRKPLSLLFLRQTFGEINDVKLNSSLF